MGVGADLANAITNMNPSLSQVIQVLAQPLPPKHISQQPFDYDPRHYRRLCRLDGAAPDTSDLSRYVDDMQYMPLQPDLLRYLLPLCLKMWQDDLLRKEDSDCRGLAEAFWTALAPRSLFQNTFLLEEELNAEEYQSVMQFMRGTLLERMNQETRLHFIGSQSSPYQWFHTLGSFCIVFPFLQSLWDKWWQMTTPGQAACVLQYISCLMYRDDENPVFTPWTPDKGGGPPELWENDSLSSDYGWRQENASFLAETLTLDIVERKLKAAASQVSSENLSISAKMLQDWDNRRDLAASRIAELPQLVAQHLHLLRNGPSKGTPLTTFRAQCYNEDTIEKEVLPR